MNERSLEMADPSDAVPVITIDGPGGSGKGTISLRLARELGWHLLDSGALYRIVAVAAMEQGIGAADEQLLGDLTCNLKVTFEPSADEVLILLDGQAIGDRLRSEAVSIFASKVSAVPQVRAALVERQRAFRKAAWAGR